MLDVVIKIESLSKVYKLYNDPVDRMKEALNPFRTSYHHDFFALKDVNFEVKKGETIGIIGKNGSGKSTLLKVLTGVLTPSDGSCRVEGKVSSLLELGAGFNPELSGLENVYFNGAILGFTKEEMDQKLDAILEFADIGEFIGQPVKNYSSGMQVRLAFAVAISVDPDILIVDEALAVGDMRFQQKCFRKFREFQKNGKTIVFVSHDVGSVNNYCDRAIWLLDGGIYRAGDPDKVTREYTSYMYYGVEDSKNNKNAKIDNCSGNVGGRVEDLGLDLESVDGCSSFGEGGARIKGVGLYSFENEEKIRVFKGGERVSFKVEFEVLKDIENPIIGFILKDKYGNQLLGYNSFSVDSKLKGMKKGESFVAIFDFDFPLLSNGDYSFTVAVAEGTQDNHVQHHWVHDSYLLKIVNASDYAKVGHFFLVNNPEFNII